MAEECGKTCKETGNDENYLKWACTTGAGIAGSLAPTALYSMLGLGTAGPVAGGWFAGM